MRVVGVDACRGGWVAVAWDGSGLPTAHLLGSIGELVSAVPDVAVVAIDIPIGLAEHDQRASDRAVRAALGARRNSLFMTPIRGALEAPTHREATAVSVAATGVGVSQQAYALRAKIFEVEAWLPTAPCPVFEVHPELSFRFLIGHPATATKKSWAGMIERRAALATAGLDLDHVDPQVGGRVGIDDLLDAAATAWTARRLLAGQATPFPDPPELDAAGRQLAIWA